MQTKSKFYFQASLMVSLLVLSHYACAEDPNVYTVKCEITYDKDTDFFKSYGGITYKKDAFIWTIDTKKNKAFAWASNRFQTFDISEKGIICMSYVISSNDGEAKTSQCINRFDGSYREDEDIKIMNMSTSMLIRTGQCQKVATRNFPENRF